MSRDLESVTKAEQCAALLYSDLRELARTDNLLLADAAQAEIERMAEMHLRLLRLKHNLETMEARP